MKKPPTITFKLAKKRREVSSDHDLQAGQETS
jgi:hypothetical protein